MRKYKNVRKTPRSSDEIDGVEARMTEIYCATKGHQIDEQIQTAELALESHQSHLEAARKAHEAGLAPDDPDAPKGWGPPMDAAEFRRLNKTLLDLRKYRDKRKAEIRARLEEAADEQHVQAEQQQAGEEAASEDFFKQIMEGADRMEQQVEEIAQRMQTRGNGKGQTSPTG